MSPSGSESQRSNPAELVQAAVQQKLQVLRLIGAMDRAGVDARREFALRAPLVRVAEFDQALTGMIVLLDRKDGKPPILPDFEIADVAEAWLSVRAKVLDALDGVQREDVLHRMEQVPVHEREVWQQVDELRATLKGKLSRGVGPLSRERVREIVAEVFQ